MRAFAKTTLISLSKRIQRYFFPVSQQMFGITAFFPYPQLARASEYVSASLGPYYVLVVVVKFTTVSGPQGRCNQSRYILSCGKWGCTLLTPTAAAVTENEDERAGE